MTNIFGTSGHQPGQPQFNPQDLDLTKIFRVVKFALGLLGLLLLWKAVSWGHEFYTDWLWYSGLGYESVLLKIVASKVVLFFVGVGLFAVLAAPNLILAGGRDRGHHHPGGRVLLPEQQAPG